MFGIMNCRTGKFVKDAITCQVRTFEEKEDAQYWADGLARDSKLNATAWNSVRPSKYAIVAL